MDFYWKSSTEAITTAATQWPGGPADGLWDEKLRQPGSLLQGSIQLIFMVPVNARYDYGSCFAAVLASVGRERLNMSFPEHCLLFEIDQSHACLLA